MKMKQIVLKKISSDEETDELGDEMYDWAQ